MTFFSTLALGDNVGPSGPTVKEFAGKRPGVEGINVEPMAMPSSGPHEDGEAACPTRDRGGLEDGRGGAGMLDYP